MRPTIRAAVLALLLMPAAAGAQDVLPAATQIAAAVQAAPEDRRAEATVLGYDAAAALTTLRKGTNEVICLADNPKANGVSVACYHRDLEPFMARGRELTAQGVTDDKVRDQTRFKEVDAGTLRMPKVPQMLYVTSGASIDPATGAIADASTRWVIYVPYATLESTGMPAKGGPGVPWLMDPGTAGAHVMISPPRPQK